MAQHDVDEVDYVDDDEVEVELLRSKQVRNSFAVSFYVFHFLCGSHMPPL